MHVKKAQDHFVARQRPILLSHIAAMFKQILLDLEWEALPHPVYSTDIALIDYHLFRSM